MNKLIHDPNMVKDFIKILPKPNDLEVFFVSLSCRNKYLTDDQRKEYALGRTEMFGQSIARDADKLFRNIRRYESHPEAYTTKNGNNMPVSAMVVYVNIDTSSTLKAYTEFQKKMTENLTELTHKSILGQSIKDTARFINKADKVLMDCYQRGSSQKKFIDVDFDVPECASGVVEKFLDVMNMNKVKHYIIQTRGGFHVLLERETIKHNYNIDIAEANDDMKSIYGDIKYEIKVNENRMVPVPGTYQAGFPVTFWEG